MYHLLIDSFTAIASLLCLHRLNFRHHHDEPEVSLSNDSKHRGPPSTIPFRSHLNLLHLQMSPYCLFHWNLLHLSTIQYLRQYLLKVVLQEDLFWPMFCFGEHFLTFISLRANLKFFC